MKSGFYAKIGNGQAMVWIDYAADKDQDNKGVFWDIDWDNVRVFFGESDITDTIGDSTWKHIEELIQEELK